jgi:hypothetical protein
MAHRHTGGRLGSTPRYMIDPVKASIKPLMCLDRARKNPPVTQDPTTMQLFLDFYKTTEPPSSSEALQSIILLSSVRRSLFTTDKERAQFLQQLVTAIREILQVGLAGTHPSVCS